MINIAYVVSSDYLQHEGILGMKWGQRNGPPYPLKPGAHSVAEVKANPKLAPSTKAKVEKVKYRNPRKLSVEDLQKSIDRMKLEEEYRKLNGKLTKSEVKDIKQLIAKNSSELFTSIMPKAVVDVGKAFYALELTFWKQLSLAAVKGISPSIGEISKAVTEGIKSRSQSRKEKKEKIDEALTNMPVEEKA